MNVASAATPLTATERPLHVSTAAPLPLAMLFGFNFGMIGERIFRDAPALLLLIFMTDYLAVPPAIAGIAIFLPKLLIIFVDTLVGLLSDRLNTRWGRRRPLMLIGALASWGTHCFPCPT